MRRIAPEIDRLMWAIAEEPEPKAAEEFAQRFPDLQGELHNRISAVKSLKGAANQPKAAKVIPQFVPRVEKVTRYQKPLVLMLAGAALFGLAMASYLLTGAFLPKPVPPPGPDPNTIIRTDVGGNPGVPSFQRDGPNPSQRTGSGGTRTEGRTPGAPEPKYDLRLESAPLSVAIEAIASATALKVEIAPGTPDPVITIEYSQMTGMEMLKDLGKQYGFTPLEQGPSEVLIVPAVDPNAGPD
jgi:hypothetical protein